MLPILGNMTPGRFYSEMENTEAINFLSPYLITLISSHLIPLTDGPRGDMADDLKATEGQPGLSSAYLIGGGGLSVGVH